MEKGQDHKSKSICGLDIFPHLLLVFLTSLSDIIRKLVLVGQEHDKLLEGHVSEMVKRTKVSLCNAWAVPLVALPVGKE